VIVYTPLRAWHSQEWYTPDSTERRAELYGLFHDGRDMDVWRRRKMVAVVDREKDPKASRVLLALGYRLSFQNANYDILLRLPLSSSPQL
jgi:hypothetical protein